MWNAQDSHLNLLIPFRNHCCHMYLTFSAPVLEAFASFSFEYCKTLKIRMPHTQTLPHVLFQIFLNGSKI